MFWKQNQIEILKTMWMEGKTAQEIGAIVERTDTAVWTKVKNLKLKRPTIKSLKNIGSFKQVRAGTPKKVKPYVDPVFIGGKPLVELSPMDCHFPYKGQIYCGGRANKPHGYCDKHHEECYKVIQTKQGV